MTAPVLTLAATGHRPDKLGGWDNERAFTRLTDLAVAYLRHAHAHNPGVTLRVVSGMAQGWDMAWAVAALRLRNREALPIQVVAAVPFLSQPKAWARNPKVQQLWQQILDACDERHILHADPRTRGEAAHYLNERNRWMLREADVVVALYNGDPRGGTANCVRDAERLGKPVKNLWASWQAHAGLVQA